MSAKQNVRCSAIRANGSLIVSGHEDGTFRRWDTKSAKPVGVQVKAHSGTVTCVPISENGSTMVTGSGDKTYLCET